MEGIVSMSLRHYDIILNNKDSYRFGSIAQTLAFPFARSPLREQRLALY